MDAVIVALASGKGGAGKTTAAVFLGGALGALGKQVALVELAPDMRSVDVIAGVSGQTVFDVEDVLSGRAAPGKALAPSQSHRGLFTISAPYSGGEIISERVRLLCTRLRAHFDYILLDVQSGMGAAFEAAKECCHRMLLFATPDTISLRDNRILVDSVDEGEVQLRLVLSRVDPERVLGEGGLGNLDAAIDLVGAQLLGVIPESPVIYRCANNGLPLPTKSMEWRVFNAIARRLAGEDVPLVFE
ncbi:MAG: septum formation initiator [Oscillospiraceae bacterium]